MSRLRQLPAVAPGRPTQSGGRLGCRIRVKRKQCWRLTAARTVDAHLGAAGCATYLNRHAVWRIRGSAWVNPSASGHGRLAGGPPSANQHATETPRATAALPRSAVH
jgi:hypothetical protein